MLTQGDFSALKNQIAREIKIMKEVALMQQELAATEEAGEKTLFNTQLKNLQT